MKGFKHLSSHTGKVQMRRILTVDKFQFFFGEFLATVEEVIHHSQLLGSICYVCLDHERSANLWTTIINISGWGDGRGEVSLSDLYIALKSTPWDEYHHRDLIQVCGTIVHSNLWETYQIQIDSQQKSNSACRFDFIFHTFLLLHTVTAGKWT